MSTAIVKAEPLKISGSTHQDREARAQTLAHAFANACVKFIGDHVERIIQVRQDFLDKGKDKTICGVKTFEEYCEGVLHYSASHIRSLIAGRNPATKKHDGSKNRKPKAKASPKTAESRPGVPADEAQEPEPSTTQPEPEPEPTIPPIATIMPPVPAMTCPCCDMPAVYEAEQGRYRCTSREEDGVCDWRSEHHPEYERGWQQHRDDNYEKAEKRAEEAKQEGFEHGRRLTIGDLVRDATDKKKRVLNEAEDHVDTVIVPADPAAVEKATKLALAFGDQLAAGVARAEAKWYGNDREKRYERLLRPAKDYLQIRGLPMDGKVAPKRNAETEYVNETPEQQEEKRRKARYTITLTVEGARLETIRKKADEAFGTALKSVEKVEQATSRGGQLEEAMGMVEDAKSAVESLKEEMEQWKDNLPENFQNGPKSEELDEAAQALEEVVGKLDEAVSESENVIFPGMF